MTIHCHRLIVPRIDHSHWTRLQRQHWKRMLMMITMMMVVVVIALRSSLVPFRTVIATWDFWPLS